MKTVVGTRVYNKLSEFLFKCKKNDVDYSIARVLLDKIHEFPDVNISEVSYLSNTTPASVSRFCKKIGYGSFFELKNDTYRFYTSSILNNFPESKNINEQKLKIMKHSLETEQFIFQMIDDDQLKEIAQNCRSAERVAIVSNTYSFSLASLFNELLSQKKIKVVTINRSANEDVLMNVLEEYDLIFLISLTKDWILKNKEILDLYPSCVKVLLTYSDLNFVSPKIDYEVSFGNIDFIFSSSFYSQRTLFLWIMLLGIMIPD